MAFACTRLVHIFHKLGALPNVIIKCLLTQYHENDMFIHIFNIVNFEEPAEVFNQNYSLR